MKGKMVIALFGKCSLLYASTWLGLSCLSGKKKDGLALASENLWEDQEMMEVTGKLAQSELLS